MDTYTLKITPSRHFQGLLAKRICLPSAFADWAQVPAVQRGGRRWTPMGTASSVYDILSGILTVCSWRWAVGALIGAVIRFCCAVQRTCSTWAATLFWRESRQL